MQQTPVTAARSVRSVKGHFKEINSVPMRVLYVRYSTVLQERDAISTTTAAR